MSTKIEDEENDTMIAQLNIKITTSDQLVVNLSGGNQQKVAIGKVLATKSDIVLMGDPTRGIDVGTKSELYQLIRSLSEEGKTIILYSTEINELIGMCDRVMVFKNGGIAALLESEGITKAAIINASLGIGARARKGGEEAKMITERSGTSNA
jgi:ABC-type sugar transport system ATPase subunit